VLAELTAWLHAHQSMLALSVAVTAALESLFIVGLLLPGVALLFAAAVLAGQGAMGLWTLLFAGWAGAVVGDGVSFIIGQRSQCLCHRWPLDRYASLLDRGKIFFERYGVLSIALGRFIGPVRPVIPAVAGLLKMPTAAFYLINALSALLWAPVYLVPGYSLGRFGTEESSLYMTSGIVAALVALALVFRLTIQSALIADSWYGRLSVATVVAACGLSLVLFPR